MSNRWALRASGAFVEGKTPFGYAVEGRKLLLIPEYVPIVVRIFTDSLEGISVRRIADALRVEYPRIVVGREKKHVMTWTVNYGAQDPSEPALYGLHGDMRERSQEARRAG